MRATEVTQVAETDRCEAVGAALDLLDRSREELLAACRSGGAGDRFVRAHLAALRAAAAVLAVRGRPARRARLRSVWDVLPAAVPELTEWSDFFAAVARRRAGVESGRVEVTGREADDLLRQAETFHAVVERVLGMPRRSDVAVIDTGSMLAPLAG